MSGTGHLFLCLEQDICSYVLNRTFVPVSGTRHLFLCLEQDICSYVWNRAFVPMSETRHLFLWLEQDIFSYDWNSAFVAMSGTEHLFLCLICLPHIKVLELGLEVIKHSQFVLDTQTQIFLESHTRTQISSLIIAFEYECEKRSKFEYGVHAQKML
jgi:hypothetical protein